jgi:urea transporter
MTARATRFGRQVLHGLSQCAFQANAVTGAVFVVAVALFNLRMSATYLLATIIGTLTARVLRAPEDLLDAGLLGFNSALTGLALGHFFQPAILVWVWVCIFAAVSAALTVLMMKLLPFPFLAVPFILIFWLMWPIAGSIGLTKIDFGAFPEADVMWTTATASALGSALFSPSAISGVVFFAGIAVSDWRHAIIALIGSFVAVALAEHAGALGGAINSGFVGFNGVLAALAAYVIVARDLRLVVFAAIAATWLASYVYRGVPVPVLASGFLLSIWGILLLAWLNPRFNAQGGTERSQCARDQISRA